MKWSQITLAGAYPFSEAALAADERAIWRSFPGDLRRVLAKSNGAIVDGQATFFTKIPALRDGKKIHGQSNWLRSLWAFVPRKQQLRADGPPSILHQHFGRHLPENFLPKGVYVFGACEQSCLVAVSTNAHDRGAIYYWEWYWRYPWYQPFFDARLAKVRKRWPKRKEIGEDHPDYPRMRDDFNYATLVKLAPSFSTWTARMK